MRRTALSFSLLACHLLYIWVGVEARRHSEEGIQRFITRNDIAAPEWQVKVHDENAIHPGYWFVSPYEKVGETAPGGEWIGPHIYDGHGGLIWSGSHLFNNMNIMDFKVVNIRGENMMSVIFAVEEDALLLDNHYQIVEAIPIGRRGSTLDMHDFRFVENGTRALYINRNFTRASKEVSDVVGFDGNCAVTANSFQEMDTTTWQPTFWWSGVDHIPLDDSTMTSSDLEQRCNNWWDYTHANAVDKMDDGNYLLSARHTDTIYKISKEDGSIIWRLGGHKSDFKMKGWYFSRQHHVRFHSQNDTHTIISIFDNAKGQDPMPPSHKFSRALLISLRTDVKPMTAEILQHFDHPHETHSPRRGDFQLLDNGNAFVCWSEQSLQTEHTPDGKMIMEAVLKSQFLGTYRSFKFPFVGLPLHPPDVYSAASLDKEALTKTTTLVHVSWNGATEVATWKLYKSTESGKTKERLLSQARTGFETALTYHGLATFVSVEALDAQGNVIGSSDVIRTVQSADIPAKALRTEQQWLKEHTDQEHSWKDSIAKMFFDPLITFFVGLVCSALILLVIWRVRRRRSASAWHRRAPSYVPLREGDAAEYDETKLDDLDGQRKDGDDDGFEVEDNSGMQSGSHSPSGTSRTPFLRQKTGG